MVGCWGLFQNLWLLSASNWLSDEPTYASAGWRYVHGLVDVNLEHPLTVKYLIGFSELVFGQGDPSGIRLPSAAASLATGALLWWWARQEAGRAAGVLCAGMWLLLPRSTTGWNQAPRLDRFAMLEPVLAFFAVAALYAGWRWIRTRRWRWAVVAGVAFALATTSKESGVVIAPVIALGGLLALRSIRAAGQLVAGTAAAVVTGLLTYVAAGSLEPIAVMVRFQSRHNTIGHLVPVRDHIYQFAPWWANFWFNEQAYGVVLSLALGVAVAAALLLRRDAVTAWVAAGMGSFLVFYCLVSQVALPFYYDAWQPEVTLLAAFGTVELARRAGASSGWPVMLKGPAAGLALVVVAIFAVASVRASIDTFHLRRHGVALLPQALDRAGVDPHSTVLMTGFHRWEANPYPFAPHQLVGKIPADLSTVSAIAVHSPRVRDRQDPAVLALVAANQGRLRHVKVDEVDLYVVAAPLRATG